MEQIEEEEEEQRKRHDFAIKKLRKRHDLAIKRLQKHYDKWDQQLQKKTQLGNRGRFKKVCDKLNQQRHEKEKKEIEKLW